MVPLLEGQLNARGADAPSPIYDNWKFGHLGFCRVRVRDPEKLPP